VPRFNKTEEEKLLQDRSFYGALKKRVVRLNGYD